MDYDLNIKSKSRKSCIFQIVIFQDVATIPPSLHAFLQSESKPYRMLLSKIIIFPTSG